MTDQCKHGSTARNCYSCFMEETHQKFCAQEKCWCKQYSASVKSVSMSELYEALQPLRDRLEKLERVSGKEVLEALTGFEKRIDMLDNAFRELLHSCNLKGPYRCPLCEGYGSVMISKDTADGPRQHYLENFACSACKGNGIVWK
jgi:hypothetical protein